MREERPYGSVRGAVSNVRPYRDPFPPPPFPHSFCRRNLLLFGCGCRYIYLQPQPNNQRNTGMILFRLALAELAGLNGRYIYQPLL